MKPSSRLVWAAAIAWVVLLGSYIAIASGMPPGPNRTAFGNVLLCLLPLFVNGALLSNATTPHWRKNAFWMLLALGISFWLAGQFVWTYIEVYQKRQVPHPFLGDIVFFLHTVPMIAALTMQPHDPREEGRGMYGYADFALIACWWVYLYAFLVLPWQYVVTDSPQYIRNYNFLVLFGNLVFVAGAAMLANKARGFWRKIYAQLAGAGSVYVIGRFSISTFIARGEYSRVSLHTLPVIISFLMIGTAGVWAYRHASEESNEDAGPAELETWKLPSGDALWVSRLARIALLSLPLIGFWCMRSQAPEAVCSFRLMLTLGAVLPFGFLAFLRQELVDAERLKLLRASQDSLDNLKRLQMQFVQSEKLASLGQLVGGAAHEINNPLTAILGYSELLADDPAVDSRSRSLAEKIREQARRTKTLVNNLLSFARQVPSEQRVPLDINTIVNSSVQFRRVDLRGKNVRIELHNADSLPQVRGDANQLLQVFTHIINNAVDSMQEAGGGGSLTVRTLFEKGNVVILFSDTGAGIRDPQLVFDPFYTTKPVGKGTGLGLSICYGLVQDQGGNISCQNRPEGGATFRIELPAVPQLFPRRVGSLATEDKPAKLA